MQSPTVYCGPMWGGKTEALISRLVRARIQGIPVVACNPVMNDRYEVEEIRSHSGASFPAFPVRTGEEIVRIAKREEASVVGIDEFFMIDSCLPAVHELMRMECKVVVATLDMDSGGQVWSEVGQLLAMAEDVTKCPAVCTSCKRDAYYTFRKGGSPDSRILVGAGDYYEPRCYRCYVRGEEAKRAQEGEESLFAGEARVQARSFAPVDPQGARETQSRASNSAAPKLEETDQGLSRQGAED